MKKLYILFLLLMPSVLVFNACGDGEPVPPPTTSNQWPKDWYIPQELLDYFYFKQGTYWVYQNNKTGDLDSIFVTTNVKNFTSPTSQGERYEIAAIDAVSSLDGYTYKYGLSMQGSAGCIKDQNGLPCYTVRCSKFKTGDVVGENTVLKYNFNIGYTGFADTRVGDKSKYIIKSFQDSVYYANVWLKNIVEISVSYCLTRNNKDYVFYWSKGLGIFKMVNTSDNEYWNLIRYNIIK